MAESRKATVCGYSITEGGNFVHLHLDNERQIAQVQVDFHPAGLRLDVEIDVPAGDLKDPTVSAGIRWPW